MRKSTHRPAYQYLVTRLKAARADAGLSQTQVAEILDTTQTFVSKVERGERRIDPVELSEFAALYGRELGYFLMPPKLGGTGRDRRRAKPVEQRVWLFEDEVERLVATAQERGEEADSVIAEAVRAYLATR